MIEQRRQSFSAAASWTPAVLARATFGWLVLLYLVAMMLVTHRVVAQEISPEMIGPRCDHHKPTRGGCSRSPAEPVAGGRRGPR
jgi:hypothetical protein